jgi:hypothetical protein
MCLAAGLILQALPNTKKWLAVWAALCVLILLSGERKAFVSFCLVSLVMFVRLRNLVWLVTAAGMIISAIAVLDDLTGGYTSRQLGSILSGPDPRNELWYILAGGTPASLSDAARRFSDQVAWKLFGEFPAFGAGLDGATKYHQLYFANAPEYLHAAVHNEFLRVAAEHGLFGLFFFFLPLARTVTLSIRDAFWFYRQYNDYFYLRLVLVVLIPSFTYMWSEGAGTEMIALFVLVAFVPDLLPVLAIHVRAGGIKRVAEGPHVLKKYVSTHLIPGRGGVAGSVEQV